MRLFASGLRKLVRRLATWLTLGLLVGLLAVILLAVGASVRRPGAEPQETAAILTLLQFPIAYQAILGFILGLGGLFAVIYGAAVAGSEWTWGTLKAAVARGESRSGYVLQTFAAIAFLVAIGLVVAFLVGIGAALLAGRIAGVDSGNLGDPATLGGLPVHLVRGWLAIVEEAALGFAVATLARSQLAGIGVGIGLYFGESFATIFLPDIVKYLPFNVANASVATEASGRASFGGNTLAALPPDTALAAVVIWLLAAIVVASLFTERAEVTG